MTLILNVLWFVFGGFISALAWTLAGVVLTASLVGLPWAPAAFRLAAYSAAPFGRHPVGRRGDETVNLLLNLVWIVLAGWWLALHHAVLAALLAVTIIGIPFALQHVKLAELALAPVGRSSM